MKGYIARERGFVVLSKGGAFPGTGVWTFFLASRLALAGEPKYRILAAQICNAVKNMAENAYHTLLASASKPRWANPSLSQRLTIDHHHNAPIIAALIHHACLHFKKNNLHKSTHVQPRIHTCITFPSLNPPRYHARGAVPRTRPRCFYEIHTSARDSDANPETRNAHLSIGENGKHANAITLTSWLAWFWNLVCFLVGLRLCEWGMGGVLCCACSVFRGVDF